MGHRQHKNPLSNLFRSHKKKNGGGRAGEGTPLLAAMEEGHAAGAAGGGGAAATEWNSSCGNDQSSDYQSSVDSRSAFHPSNYNIGDAALGFHVRPHQKAATGKKDYWKILRERVKGGDLLLHGIGNNEHLKDRANERSSVMMDRNEQKIQEAIDEIRQGMEFGLWHCLIAIVIYLGIAVACFNTIFEPSWSILDSVYFAVVTFSTVGYGDEVPTTHASMIFTCFYALSGVAILGIALGILGSNLVDAQEAMANKAENLLKYQVLSVFDTKKTSQVKSREDILYEEEHGGRSKPSDDDDEEEMLRQPSFFRSTLSCLKSFLPLLGVMLGMAYWIGNRAGWSLLEITYFLIVTATTVGYGDFTPKSDEEKMIALLFIPVAVGAMGVWLGGVANIIVESRSARYRRNMGMKELTQHDLDIMDRDGDGAVTRAEFLEFMLVAMNKIDQTLVDELRQHFDRLDADGTGELTKNDLIEVARAKLKSPVHKLHLSMYKKRLMNESSVVAGARTRRGLMAGWSPQFFSHMNMRRSSDSISSSAAPSRR